MAKSKWSWMPNWLGRLVFGKSKWGGDIEICPKCRKRERGLCDCEKSDDR